MEEEIRNEQTQFSGMNESDPQRHQIADEDYDVISVIYHCLKGCETAKKYERDARDAGESDLADYFQQVQRMNLALANRGRQFLKSWVNREGVSEGSARSGRSNVAMMPPRQSNPRRSDADDSSTDSSGDRSQAV